MAQEPLTPISNNEPFASHKYPNGVRKVNDPTDTVMTSRLRPNDLVMPNVPWGRPDVLFTPAYWACQLRMHPELGRHGVHRLGESLKEESAACILGGHGIPARIGLAAYHAVREAGLLDRHRVSADDVYAVLSRPLDAGGRRNVRYRFARQKSIYLAGLLNGLTDPPCEVDARSLRDWLMGFPGVGPKTASWIVRNWLESDQVAIIDIHIHRAGVLTGFFQPEQVVAKDYMEMELQFLAFSNAIGARSSTLDALIWSQLRQANSLAIRLLRQYHESTSDATEVRETGVCTCPATGFEKRL